MNSAIEKLVCTSLIFLSFHAQADSILTFTLPFGNTIQKTIEGTVSIETEISAASKKITRSFYGADSHGFSRLPPSSLVTPLNLGAVKLAGNLHALYNWEYNAYYNNNEIQFAYASLIDRLQMIKKGYQVDAMFEVNMLGLQPDSNSSGRLVFTNTANAQHAADAVTYLNGKNKLGLKNFMMGNEPFDSEEFNDIHIPSADDYIKKYIEYAVAMREAQEKISGNPNDIKLWGPELNTGWTGWQTNHLPDCIIDYNQADFITCSYGNGTFKDFVPYFLSRLSEFEKDPLRNPKGYKMLDYLTIHYYALFRKDFNDPTSIIKDESGNQDVHAMLESVNVWDSETYVNLYDRSSRRWRTPNIIHQFKDWSEHYYPNVKLGVTEFGVDSMDKIKYHPIVRPLYLADFVGRAATAGLDAFINSFLQSGDVSNSWAMIDGSRKTTIYNVYSLFTNYFLGDTLVTSDTFDDAVNSYAVKTSNGTNVFIINKDTVSHTMKLQFTNEQNVTEMDLPPWSLSVLKVSDKHEQDITVYQYGAKEMGIPVAPMK